MREEAGGEGGRVAWLQRALKAVVEGLKLVGEDVAEPPPGSLQVPLLPHQAMALAWYVPPQLPVDLP